MRQLAAGLYGALVVLEPGQRWNDSTDHVFAIAQGGFLAPAWTVVNGVPAGPPLSWKQGVAHRLRFLSLTVDNETDISIERVDGQPVVWRPIAKDGTALTVAQSAQPARLHIGPGETYDFEFVPSAGSYRVRFESLSNVLFTLEVH